MKQNVTFRLFDSIDFYLRFMIQLIFISIAIQIFTVYLDSNPGSDKAISIDFT
jgi:hypothetical protein